MTKRRFELTDGKSSKFWSVEVDGARVLVHYGRIGTGGRTSDKELADAEAANKHADKLIAQKLGKGYAEVGGSPVAKKSAKRGAKTQAAKGLGQHFERIPVTAQVIEDHGLGEAPLDGTVYVGTGKIVVEPAQIEELQTMLGDGVVVDGELVVKGHVLLDDGCTLRADKITCESMTLNECWVWVGRAQVRDYVWLDGCALHGYAVDIDAVKTSLLVVDEGALATVPWVSVPTAGRATPGSTQASSQLNH